MKNYIKIITVLTIASILFIACSNGNKRNANFLPPLKITIANEIKDNEELVAIIKSSEKAMNEFSDNMEQLAEDGKAILNKKEEDKTLKDTIKMGQLLLGFGSNRTQMAATIEKFSIYVEIQKEQEKINDTQLKALEQVGTDFTNRIAQFNEKYKDYFNK